MGNSTNKVRAALDASKTWAQFLATAIGDGTINDLLGTTKVDQNPGTVSRVPFGQVNQYLMNVVDDAIQVFYEDHGETTSLLDWKDSVRAATVAALPANTLSSGVLTADAVGALPAQDGVSLSVDDGILVKDEGAGTSAKNGIYTVTSLGSGATPWVLTRRSDADTDNKVTAMMAVPVSEGTTPDTQWILTTNDPITVDTTALTFSQFGAGGGETLAQTLAIGNTSGNSDIIVDHGQSVRGEEDGDGADGGDLALIGGAATAAGCDGGDISIVGAGGTAGSGAGAGGIGGRVVALCGAGGDGGATGNGAAGGDVAIYCGAGGDGGATSGNGSDGGDWLSVAGSGGDAPTSGDGGDGGVVNLAAGAAGDGASAGVAGVAGSVTVTSGAGGANANGDGGDSGNISLTSAAGVAGTGNGAGGDGGDVGTTYGSGGAGAGAGAGGDGGEGLKTGGNGGNGGATGNGGKGSNWKVECGDGGAGGATSGNGGIGGSVWNEGGAGGSATTSGTGGSGGVCYNFGGVGGNAVGSGGGGAGGNAVLQAGDSGNSAGTSNGQGGGETSLTAGDGGDGGPTNANGGTGGPVDITAGDGGNGSGTAAAGTGGNVVVSSGDGGAGGESGGNPGQIRLQSAGVTKWFMSHGGNLVPASDNADNIGAEPGAGEARVAKIYAVEYLGAAELSFKPTDAEFPATNFAVLDERNNHPVLVFASGKIGFFTEVMPKSYNGGDIDITIMWAGATATAGDVRWNVQIERLGQAGQDLDADGFDTVTYDTDTTYSTCGMLKYTTITVTAPTDSDDLEAGELFRIKVERGGTGDTMTGDAQIAGVGFKEVA